MQLVLTGTAGKIRASLTGGDGEATAPSAPTVTIVRDSDGMEIVSASAATVDGNLAVITLDPDDIPHVDRLVATFTDGTAFVVVEAEVVGGFLCSLAEIATATGESDPATLRALREAAERRLEDACGAAFRPRYARETLACDGTDELILSRPRPLALISAELDGTDVTAELTLELGGTVRSDSYFASGSSLEIAYSHGWQSAPEPIAAAAVKLATALAENADDRISRFREDEQEIFLTVAGVGGALTSMPDVNAAIEAYKAPRVIG